MTSKKMHYLNIWTKVVLSLGVLTFILVEYVRPLVVDRLYSDEYKWLAIQCDNAMHDEVSIRFSNRALEKQELLIKSADVELLVCHEYDKLRKKMLSLGVGEEQLALHGLEALEIESIPVSRMVEPHRMPRF
jgi:hypothetical protein